MENTSNENIAAALKLLDEAAKQKKDELKTVMSDKYNNLRDLLMETESSLMKTLTDTKAHAIEKANAIKAASIAKAREVAGDVDKSVHQNPWLYIAGSAAVGAALGYFLGRSRK